MKITDEMVERASIAYYAPGNYGTAEALRRALEAALNPPPALCKNCGNLQKSHQTVWMVSVNGVPMPLPEGRKDYTCPGYVFEAAP